ncbi:MAG: hypothetical protein V1676_06970 [Candidatus Diapherotrites archaeon]
MSEELHASCLVVEPFTEEHDVSAFDCFSGHAGDRDLNDFIKNDALAQKEEGWNRTYVAVQKGGKKVMGFFALSQDAITIDRETRRRRGKDYGKIPAIKIGRLAVDKACQNKGVVGPFLVCYAMGFIVKKIVPLVGGMYITLDSYPHRAEWYKKKFNFRENTLIKQDGATYVNLIFPIKDFRE